MNLDALYRGLYNRLSKSNPNTKHSYASLFRKTLTPDTV